MDEGEKMQISDYIVSFFCLMRLPMYLDIRGEGGMVTCLMESFDKHCSKIRAHLCYHEQGAALAACGYAQASGKMGVAYATSGPGATNLITGIANAFFDSIPCLFITGQVNTSDIKNIPMMRQHGFQETDIVSIVKPITKYAVQITDAKQIRFELEKAYAIAMEGRKGPALLDIPLNIQRTDISPEELDGYDFSINDNEGNKYRQTAEAIIQRIQKATRPVLVVGAGIRQCGAEEALSTLIDRLKIPVLTSMIGVDVISSNSPYAFGFLGAYGH